MIIHNAQPHIAVPGQYIGKCEHQGIDPERASGQIFLIIVDQIRSPYLFFSGLKIPYPNYTISSKKEQSYFSNILLISVNFFNFFVIF